MSALPVRSATWKQGNEEGLSEIRDCLCVNCNSTKGVTLMLPTMVPFFREIIVMSFHCPDCNFRNNEVSFGGEIQRKGERLAFKVTSRDDLNRQIIKSDSATLAIPQLELEIPPETQRGTVSTIEGIFRRAADDLEALQPDRLRLGDVENFHRCRQVIDGLRNYAEVDGAENNMVDPLPFDIILDDPAGNSYIENPSAPAADPNLVSEKYFRSVSQARALGLQPTQQAVDGKSKFRNPTTATPGKHTIKVDPNQKNIQEEVMKFVTPCPQCRKKAETSMCLTNIPHFKEVIIMSLLCDECGFKSNEIKWGGAIPKLGTRITLSVNTAEDLERDVLKSDTAGVRIPDIDLTLEEGGLDGLYTTVEGLLRKMHDRLAMANPFGSGDASTKQHSTNDGAKFSAPAPHHVRFRKFLQTLEDMADGRRIPFSLELSDPLSNSFVGPIPAQAKAISLEAERNGVNHGNNTCIDKRMKIEKFVRTFEQNEILGLNDMKTEGYAETDVDVTNCGTNLPADFPDRFRRMKTHGQ